MNRVIRPLRRHMLLAEVATAGGIVPTLNLEMEVTDFESWRTGFARRQAVRDQGGVMSYRVWRVLGDSRQIIVDLDFTSVQEAQEFLEMLRTEVWSSEEAAAAISAMPKTRLLEPVEDL